MTSTFLKKTFWLTVSLASVALWLPVTESGAIRPGSGSLDQLTRERRSEGRNHGESDIHDERADYSEERLAGYRFGDEYFKDRSEENEEASEKAEISGNDKAAAASTRADGCERVVKDSMICMICEDPKTHSKYEQCSYVARPRENIQSYASSKSYSDRPAAASQQNNRRERHEIGSGEQRNNDEASGEKTSSHEPESSEERASGYSSNDEDEQGKSYDDDYYGDASKYGRNEDRLSSSSSHESPDRRAHRPKSSGSKNNKANCREVRKDSMTCTICKDADNGGNFEKCSYAHQPNDKLYKYSKSKSFGYPGESSDARESKRVDKMADPPPSAATDNNNSPRQCQRFRKNSSTICNICRDTATGEKFQECEYNLKPAQHSHERRQISRTAR